MAPVQKTPRVFVGLGLLGFLVALAGCEAFISQPQYPPPPPPPRVAVPPPSRPLFYVNASRLNLRACPGMDCPKVATLERNDEVERMAETEDWIQVRVKRDGSIGWVAARYLSDSPVPVDMAPVPPVAEPPVPEVARPEPPIAPEKPKPVKPAETYLPKPAPKPTSKPAEAAEPEAEPVAPAEPKPAPAKPAPPPTPAPAEKPAPAKPAPEPEQPKKIRIM